MANYYGIPLAVEHRLRERDKRCVYCGRAMRSYRHTRGTPSDKATLEHLKYRGPVDWGEGLERSGLQGIAICCGSCNSSRGNKPLAAWFKSAYCAEYGINAQTVAPL